MSNEEITLTAVSVESVPRPEHGTRVASEATPLPDVSLDDVLSKLPASVPPAQTVKWLRESSEPPPLTGVIEAVPFEGTASAPPAVAEGPVRVVRITPTGDVTVGTRVSIAFDRPVFPVGWVGKPDKVSLVPEPPGRWRALGSSVLVFDVEDRLPGATEFEIVVEAGFGSQFGVELSEEIRETFRTPPLRLLAGYPKEKIGAGARPVIVLRFDQRVSRRRIIEKLSLDGNPMTAVTQSVEELRKIDERAADFIADARDRTWLAVRPDHDLTSGQRKVRVHEGAPSAEGSRLTEDLQTHAISVAGAFRVLSVSAGSGKPNSSIEFKFSNAVDVATVRAEDIVFKPGILSAPTVNAYANSLYVRCRKRPRTKLHVTLPDTVRDVFGQPLGGDRTHVLAIGAADARLRALCGDMVVFHADQPHEIPVEVTNVGRMRVCITVAEPSDYPAFINWRSARRDAAVKQPGTNLHAEEFTFDAPDDVATVVDVDLENDIAQGVVGHRIVEISSAASGDLWPIRMWVQSTRLGVSLINDAVRTTAWVTDLQTAVSVEGCQVRQMERGTWDASATSHLTDSHGRCELVESARQATVIASAGDDSTFIDIYPHLSAPDRRLRGHIFCDRGIYRPGEVVRIEGWLRESADDAHLVIDYSHGSVHYVVSDVQGWELARGATELDEFGRFEIAVSLPETPGLGAASVRVSKDRTTLSHAFDIQEFRRPDIEVTAVTESPAPHLTGDDAVFRATAKYYTGESLGGLAARWVVTAKPTTYVPPGWSGYAFVEQRSPWALFFGQRATASDALCVISNETALDGSARIRVEATSPRPVSVEASVAITDISRQTWAAAAVALVHPSSHYVGVNVERAFVDRDSPIVLQLVVVDLDGVPQVGRQVVVALEHGARKLVGGVWTTQWDEVRQTVVTSQDGPVRVEFASPQAGRFRVVARTADAEDRRTSTEVPVWVSGATARQTTQSGSVVVAPARQTYRSAEVLQVNVLTAVHSGRGLLALVYDAVVAFAQFEVEDGSGKVSVELPAGLIGNVGLVAEICGTDVDGHAAFGTGLGQVLVDDDSVRLGVEVGSTVEAVEPGSEVEIRLEATLPHGGPAADGRATIWVVDEAVLAVSGFETPDPIPGFYPPRIGHAHSVHTRSLLMRSDALETDDAVEGMAFGGAPAGAPGANAQYAAQSLGAGGAPPAQPVALRTDFAALAAYHANVTLDASGRASVQAKLPDSLTRWRIMANVGCGPRFAGSGEGAVICRLPLTVRPAVPRFAKDFPVPGTPMSRSARSVARVATDVSMRRRLPRYLAEIGVPSAAEPPMTKVTTACGESRQPGGRKRSSPRARASSSEAKSCSEGNRIWSDMMSLVSGRGRVNRVWFGRWRTRRRQRVEREHDADVGVDPAAATGQGLKPRLDRCHQRRRQLGKELLPVFEPGICGHLAHQNAPEVFGQTVRVDLGQRCHRVAVARQVTDAKAHQCDRQGVRVHQVLAVLGQLQQQLGPGRRFGQRKELGKRGDVAAVKGGDGQGQRNLFGHLGPGVQVVRQGEAFGDHRQRHAKRVFDAGRLVVELVEVGQALFPAQDPALLEHEVFRDPVRALLAFGRSGQAR